MLDMHDVKGAAGFPGQFSRGQIAASADRQVLNPGKPGHLFRLAPVGHATAAASVVLSMDGHEQLEFRRPLIPAQAGIVDPGKAVDPACAHEGLEPNRTGLLEIQPTCPGCPEPVHPKSKSTQDSFSAEAAFQKPPGVQYRRLRIERHVEKRGPSPRC